MQAEKECAEAAELAQAAREKILLRLSQIDFLTDIPIESSAGFTEAVSNMKKAEKNAKKTEKALKKRNAELTKQHKEQSAHSTARYTRLRE